MKVKSWVLYAACLVVAGCAGQTINQFFDNPDSDQDQAWSDDCKSNIKRLATAMAIYTTDYDDRFPAPDWRGIESYYVSQRFTACPPEFVRGVQHFSYAFNIDAVGILGTSVTDPGRFPIFFEVDADVPYMVDSFTNILRTPRHKNDIWWTAMDTSVQNINDPVRPR